MIGETISIKLTLPDDDFIFAGIFLYGIKIFMKFKLPVIKYGAIIDFFKNKH